MSRQFEYDGAVLTVFVGGAGVQRVQINDRLGHVVVMPLEVFARLVDLASWGDNVFGCMMLTPRLERLEKK